MFDVDLAYCRIPIAPIDQLHLCAAWRGSVYIDHCCPFGLASASGIYGCLGDVLVEIFYHYSIKKLLKWVDDHVFFRSPSTPISNSSDVTTYDYDESLITAVAHALGVPWSLVKQSPFHFIFTYIEFIWNLIDKSVSLSPEKRNKYITKLSSWNLGAAFSLKECQSIIGTLNHCCLVHYPYRSVKNDFILHLCCILRHHCKPIHLPLFNSCCCF